VKKQNPPAAKKSVPGKPAVQRKETAPATGSDLRRILLPALVILLTFIAYIPSLKNSMLLTWDDQAYVVNNDLVKGISASHIAKIFTEDKGLYANYHPLTILSLAVNYAVSGVNPAGYIGTNLLLHLINTLLVFLLVFRLSGGRRIMAFATSLLFGLHPIHVESVAWISERKDVLYTFFFLLSLLTFHRWTLHRDGKMYAISLLLFVCSLLSKAMAASLPLALVLTDNFLNRRWTLRSLLDKVPFLALAIGFGFLAISIQSSGHALGSILFPMGYRILHACYGFIMYLALLVFPAGLSAYYPYPYPLSGVNWIMGKIVPEFLVTLVLALMIGVITILLMVKKKPEGWKYFVFGIFFYFVTIVMVLQFLPVGRAIMADRYAYVPSIGLFFIVGYLFDRYYAKQKFRVAAVSIMLLYSGFLLYSTFSRCQVWKDDEKLWSDVIRKYPEDSRSGLAYTNRANYFEKMEKYDEALADYLTVVRYNPRDAFALQRAGKIYGQKKGDLDNALVYLLRSYEVDPKNPDVLGDLGTVYGIKGDVAKSLEYSLKGLDLVPNDPSLIFNVGVCYDRLGQKEKGKEYMDKAVKLDPSMKRP
jgi:protein O-mannosyl-transferase